ncbi:MAG: MFS transporter, partial [Oscillospiraceae bacterium]|nr:MFS transporter [Oscillospiraceae bacterium]
MKLNYKRTIFVGFAFFLISAFWQAYDTTIPLILTNKFGLSQTVSGVVMAFDNILALFMLPLFGAISDRTKTKLGKRTPFILAGTIVAAAAFIALSFVDAHQLSLIQKAAHIDDPEALAVIYEQQADNELSTPDGEHFVLSEEFSKEEFTAIRSQIEGEDGKFITNPDYTDFVTPARQAYAAQITKAYPSALILFIALLLITLIAMATFRSPAVALMPDVTVKPLRSKANAVINLMGTAGGILVLVLGMVFATSSVKNSMMNYTGFFTVIALIMLGGLAVFMLKVREPEFAAEMQAESHRLGLLDREEMQGGSRSLTAAEKRSLLFILLSIVCWFFGYNAVTSKYSVYAANILHKDYNLTLLIAQGAAIVSYLPVGFVASKVGRKKTIIAGVLMLFTAFGAAAFMRADSPTMLMNALFALAGIA